MVSENRWRGLLLLLPPPLLLCEAKLETERHRVICLFLCSSFSLSDNYAEHTASCISRRVPPFTLSSLCCSLHQRGTPAQGRARGLFKLIKCICQSRRVRHNSLCTLDFPSKSYMGRRVAVSLSLALGRMIHHLITGARQLIC